MSEIMILAVCFQLKQLKKQPENKSGLNGTRTHDLAIPVQCSYMIFIYSYLYIFTIIGYMTNSQLTIYLCGLIVQWIEHCTLRFSTKTFKAIDPITFLIHHHSL